MDRIAPLRVRFEAGRAAHLLSQLNMTDHDLGNTAREELLRLVCACYYEPDPQFDEEQLFAGMLEAAGRLGRGVAELAAKLGKSFASQDLRVLAADYSRLFLAAEPLARPQEAFWLDASSPDWALALVELYHEAGFDAGEEFMTAPDHVAVELEFLSLLACRQGEARRAGLAEVQSAWDQLHQLLVSEHLARWIGPFAAAVRARAETPFYRDLAELTELLVRREAAICSTPFIEAAPPRS